MAVKQSKRKVSFIEHNDIPFPVIIQSKANGIVIDSNKAAKRLLRSSIDKGKKIKIKWLGPSRRVPSEKCDGVLEVGETKSQNIFIQGYRKIVKKDDVEYILNFIEIVTSQSFGDNSLQVKDLSIPSVWLNDDNVIIDWNAAAEAILGWRQKDVVGRNIDVVFSIERSEKYLKVITGSLKNRVVDFVLLRRDGNEVELEITINVTHRGDRRYLLLTIRDASSEKIVEEKLRQSENNLKRVQTIAAIGSWEMSGRFQETYWSDEFYRIHGLKPQSVKPSTGLRLRMVHPHDRSKLETAIDNAVKKGEPYCIEKRIIRPDGTIRWVLSQGEATVDDGTGRRRVFGTILDITVRKLSELLNEEIEKSLNKAQSIASIGSWEIIGDSDEIYWSDEFYRLLGLEPQKVTPSLKLRLSKVHPEDRKMVKLAMKRIADDAAPFTIEERLILDNGEVRWMLSQGESSIDPVTGKKKIFGTLLDITNRKKVEQEQLNIKNRFRRTLIFSRIGTAELDTNTGVLTIDDELDLLLEGNGEILRSMQMSDFLKLYIVPEDIPSIEETIVKGIQSASLSEVSAEVTIEFRMKTHSGNILNIEAHGAFDRNGKALGILRDVTRKKRAEQDAIVKNEIIGKILSGITDGFFATDRNLNFILVNPLFSKLAAMPSEEIVGRNMFDLYPHLKGSKLAQAYINAIETGRSNVMEIENSRTKGQFFQLNIYPNSQGLFIHYKDISDSKKAEADLIESRNTFSNLIDNLPGYVYRVKNDYAYTPLFISPQVEMVTGYHVDEYLVSKTISCGKEIHPDDASRVWKLIQDAVSEKNYYEFEFRIMTKYGEEKWLWEKGKGIFDENDKLMYLEGFVMDISDRKKAEFDLIGSEERFRLLYNNTPALMHSTNLDGELIRVSDYWLQKLGYKREEVLGRKITEFQTELSQDKMANDYLPSLLSTGKIRSANLQFVTKSGSILETLLSASAEYDDKGRVIKSMAVITDISERNRVVELLNVISDNLPSVAIYQYEVKAGDYFGTYKYYSSGVKRITGLSAYELLQNPEIFEERIHPSDIDEKHRRINEANEHQSVFDQVYRFQHRNGTWRWLRTKSQPTRLNDGSTLWNGLIIDMTEQKDAEKNLLFARFTIDHASDAIFWIRSDSSIEDINPGALKSLGYSFEEMLLMKIPDLDSSVTNDIWSQHWQELREKQSVTYTTRLRRKDGTAFDVEVNSNFIVFQDQEFNCAFVRDITDRKVAENKLRLNWETYKALFESNPMPLWIYDQETFRFVQVNDTAVKKYGYSKEEFATMTIHDIRLIDEKGRLTETIIPGLGEFNHSGGWKHKRKDGSELEVEIYSHELFHFGRNCRFVIANDISEQRKAQQELIESEQRFNAFMKYTPVSGWIMDNNGVLKYINDSYYRMFSFEKGNAIGKSVYDLYPEAIAKQFIENNETVSSSGESLESIEFVPRSDNSLGEFLVYRFPMGNNLIGAVAADITQQRKTEREAHTALKEKEVLIKEIHHRVKNNLQLISSIIYLKMQTMTQSDIKNFLEETRKKIRTISLIHERLLQTESVNQIDIADYLGKLIADLQMTNTRQDLIIKISSEIESFQMKLDMAIYYGLIVNELVTNSIKHAFINRSNGNIKVELRKMEGYNYLMVGDDGTSLPIDIAPAKSGSFGMQLLNIFIKQLNGEMEIERGNGTTFKISFIEILSSRAKFVPIKQ